MSTTDAHCKWESMSTNSGQREFNCEDVCVRETLVRCLRASRRSLLSVVTLPTGYIHSCLHNSFCFIFLSLFFSFFTQNYSLSLSLPLFFSFALCNTLEPRTIDCAHSGHRAQWPPHVFVGWRGEDKHGTAEYSSWWDVHTHTHTHSSITTEMCNLSSWRVLTSWHPSRQRPPHLTLPSPILLIRSFFIFATEFSKCWNLASNTNFVCLRERAS